MLSDLPGACEHYPDLVIDFDPSSRVSLFRAVKKILNYEYNCRRLAASSSLFTRALSPSSSAQNMELLHGSNLV